MELKQLSYFVKLCQVKNFSVAAEQLYISQQGLSMSIKRLEGELGCPLLLRKHKKIELTKEGKYLYNQALQITKLANECLEHYQKQYKQNETLHITTSLDILGMLPLALQEILRNKNNNFTIELSLGAGRTCETFLSNGTSFLGFICGPIDEQKYRSKLLMTQDYFYIMNINHPLAQKEYLEISDFKNQPLIFPDKDTKIYHEFSNLCKKHGFKANFDIISSGQTYAHNVVKQDTTHIGQILEYNAKTINDPGVLLKKLRGYDLKWKLYLVSPQQHSLTQKEKEFQKITLDLLKNYSL